MRKNNGLYAALFLGIFVACGSGSGSSDKTTTVKSLAGDAEYGELEVGADWKTYTKVNTQQYIAETHGGRFVDVYVNSVGLEAYKNEDAELPVGSIIVKTSKERDGDKASSVDGPIFVMEKRQKGYDAEHDDWWYGFHWAKVPKKWQSRLGKQAYWRSPSKKVNYCWECHENYNRNLGMVPKKYRNW